MVDVDLRLGIAFFEEEQPSVGVEIGAVVGLIFNYAVAHCLSLVEVFTLFAQVIGIVVEAPNIIGLPLQTTVVSGESLVYAPLLVENLAHQLVKIRHDILVAVGVYLRYAPSEGVEGLVFLVFLIASDTFEVVKHHLFGVVSLCGLAKR